MRRRVITRVMWLLLVLIVQREPARWSGTAKTESLSSWNDGPSKKSIIDFVTA